ncbi:MAG: histidine--tRNA ligase [Clostridia bacterium]|jgi:histidyl-tRNA synthetase|nr:histidine--tRNA ligase [Clostridia bacterium]
MLTRAPKGTKDVLPGESYKWQYIEKIMRDVCARFAYREIRTPTFEHTELFLRGIGDTTDVVQKEMYTFLDKKERSITLKPEGTAGVVRSFVESSMGGAAQPTKMYYLNCPVFRYENPQHGRYREHHQFGIEGFGSEKPSIDAEVISLALTVLRELGVSGLALNINSIGCKQCRPDYNKALIEYLSKNKDGLCRDCQQRMGTNPLRVLDCKQETCSAIVKNAPKMIDYLCGECSTHFDGLKARLKSADIDYVVNPMIVRGLDYYTKTVFEIISTDIGALGTVCGGGRYDELVEELGGKPTPGIGFGMGMERLLLVLESLGIDIPEPSLCDVYVCTLGENASEKGFKITADLRAAGIKAECDHTGRSMKAQMKYAGKIGAGKVIIIGENEIAKGVAAVRDMKASEEKTVAFEQLNEFIKGGE